MWAIPSISKEENKGDKNMGLFPSLELEDPVAEELNKPMQGSLFRTIEYEISDIVKKIQNIDNLNDVEIVDIIIRQHTMILNYDLFLTTTENRRNAQILFTNKKFLRSFLNVIRVLDITPHEKICINKISYDYYIASNGENSEIADLLYQLTKEVNGKEVIVLSGIYGLRNAQILSMIRNSTFNVEKAVHRVNTFLIKARQNVGLANIITTYCFLFERFTHTFIYTMLEAEPAGLDQQQKEIFDTISLAILDILNSLTTFDMSRVLSDYAYTISMVKNNTPVRFSLKTCDPIKYKRILSCISRLETTDGLFIP